MHYKVINNINEGTSYVYNNELPFYSYHNSYNNLSHSLFVENNYCNKELAFSNPCRNNNLFDSLFVENNYCKVNFAFETKLSDNYLKKRDLLDITKPRISDNLVVNVQHSWRINNYNFNEGEWSNIPPLRLLEHSWIIYNYHFNEREWSNIPPLRLLEHSGIINNYRMNQRELYSYPCIQMQMDNDCIRLNFDPTKLIISSYLDAICLRGREVLLNHFDTILTDATQVNHRVDNFPFSSIMVSGHINQGISRLCTAFVFRVKSIFDPNRFYPFSVEYGNINIYNRDDTRLRLISDNFRVNSINPMNEIHFVTYHKHIPAVEIGTFRNNRVMKLYIYIDS